MCRRRSYSRRRNTSASWSPNDNICWSWTGSTSRPLRHQGVCQWSDLKAAMESCRTTDPRCMPTSWVPPTHATNDDLHKTATVSTPAVCQSRNEKTRWYTHDYKSVNCTLCLNKNLAIANRSRVSCAHNTSRASMGLITHDLEIYVKSHSSSLETEPLDTSYTTYY